ncbi:sigma D regulator [Dongshaea marina]|uniref:sigma D regulator n=1 Tax=Dongshaea marina TaxID=2047966 RepID=UPI000D3E372A|nr:sigma D regulator [Dongshaea marina]
MIGECEQSKYELAGQHSLISDWLEARQALLVAYIELANPKEGSLRPQPETDELQNFCQLLVDYVSAGHFELYRYVMKAYEQASGKSLKIAQRIYPHIQATTEYALQFSDKYSQPDEEQLLQLDEELNKLGPILEERFRNEDRMAAVLHIFEMLNQEDEAE